MIQMMQKIRILLKNSKESENFDQEIAESPKILIKKLQKVRKFCSKTPETPENLIKKKTHFNTKNRLLNTKIAK
jgi:hypothetical protein